jgi:uracil-DNA glycosylase family 4
MADEAQRQLRAYVEYFRDLGVYDFYRNGEPFGGEPEAALQPASALGPEAALQPAAEPMAAAELVEVVAPIVLEAVTAARAAIGGGMGLASKLVSFDDLAPRPEVRVALAGRAAALRTIQEEIGDCTRCPLAYAGRRNIVFGDGDAGARVMFVGEGPGADEDASGVPFVGKAGQLLNNMIQAMGLKREEVYIANIVKCRPPANRAPEPIEANTCTQFLVRQMDVVQPQVVVALGATAAMYLLGVKQSLASLRGVWHSCRGAKLAVTYHPAFLLRDPRMKGEAWKDLQMVMAEMGLKGPSK